MKYAFAGDREISVNILSFLLAKGYSPSALIVSDGNKASHAEELIRVSNLDDIYIFKGNEFKELSALRKLKNLNLDYILGIHFPFLIPKAVLEIPKIGVINLHPAYLPYNKGWHTPSWAILNNKEPYGATLHFMEEKLDQGDIIHQKAIQIDINDTANTLYERVLRLEEKVFYEAFEGLVSLNPPRKKQLEIGSTHLKKELSNIQEIFLEEKYTARDILNKLRALTTNSKNEAAFFVYEGKKISVQIILE